MFTDTQYYDLFEELAMKHVSIQHSSSRIRFFKTPDEVPDKDLANEFYMILLPPTYDYADLNSDNLIERIRGEFLILKPVERENYNEALNTRTEAREIARNILSRLQKLRKEKLFNEFTIGQSRGNPIGPILENCHGVSYEFIIGDSAGIFYNPQNWIDG
ncbi:MAG TPA: hypothetical protein PKD91_09115 [Bacteroidia bacterium]|nr:hypothetical protein [Bacteroidia bacterium]